MTYGELSYRAKKLYAKGKITICEYLEMTKPLDREIEQEPCDDAISRQAVQDYIAKYLSQYLYKDVREAVEVIDEYIGELPSVKPQQKIGHWISFGVQGEVDGQIVQTFTCSECGAISIFRLSSGNIVNGDLCPNCGAKMKSEDEK